MLAEWRQTSSLSGHYLEKEIGRGSANRRAVWLGMRKLRCPPLGTRQIPLGNVRAIGRMRSLDWCSLLSWLASTSVARTRGLHNQLTKEGWTTELQLDRGRITDQPWKLPRQGIQVKRGMGGYWSSSNRRGNGEGVAGGQAKAKVNQRRGRTRRLTKQTDGLHSKLFSEDTNKINPSTIILFHFPIILYPLHYILTDFPSIIQHLYFPSREHLTHT